LYNSLSVLLVPMAVHTKLFLLTDQRALLRRQDPPTYGQLRVDVSHDAQILKLETLCSSYVVIWDLCPV